MGEAEAAPVAGQAVTVEVINARALTLDLVLEPWGDVHALPPSRALKLVVTDQRSPVLEVEIRDDAIVVWVEG